MDNHGWGLKAMLGFCGVLALCIVLVSVAINKNFKEYWDKGPIINPNINDDKPGNNSIINENESYYRKIEGEMIKATQNYIKAHYTSGTPEGTRLTITVKSLQRDNKIGEIKDPINNNISCSGYVNVLRDTSIENYDPYLKCGERYETGGYLERLDGNA